MKNIGETIGLAVGGFASVGSITGFTNFKWYEIVFILFWVLIWAIVGGILGMIIQESLVKIYAKWTGKKTQSKQQL